MHVCWGETISALKHRQMSGILCVPSLKLLRPDFCAYSPVHNTSFDAQFPFSPVAAETIQPFHNSPTEKLN